MRSWLRSLRDRLIPLADLRADLRALRKSQEDQRRSAERLEARVTRDLEREQQDLAGLDARLRALEGAMTSRLDQQDLLLRRLEFLATGGASPRPVAASLTLVPPARAPSTSSASTLDRMAAWPTDVRRLDRCAVCGGTESTLACEWNKFLLLGGAPDRDAVEYDYAMCHRCGVLSARRRPVGERFRHLISNFVEATGKEAGSREVANPLFNPYPLTDGDRDELRRLIARGVFVSEHSGVSKQDFLVGALRDRLEASAHVEVIQSLVPIADARVLEIRPRAGSILAAMKRLQAAEVVGLPIWESQRFIIKELYGIESPGLIDFVDFRIADDRPFDLIVCNHMLTHAIDPVAFLAEIRRHLTPHGHLYLFNEPDDSEFLKGGQSMIATLNPFHMQAFDQPSLVRALAANGFETVFSMTRDLDHLCLARRSDTVSMPAMSDGGRTRRLGLYADARLRALLKLPEPARARLTVDWDDVTREAVVRGLASLENGRVKLRRPA